MPELPEVETTLRGIKPHILGQQITKVIIRHFQLRWPIPDNLSQLLKNQIVLNIKRRAKYLLFEFKHGSLILHLGMSGRLRILSEPEKHKKHDHVDICFANNYCLRFTDTRRFGAILWTDKNIEEHRLIKNIGVEPLSKSFTGGHLWTLANYKKISIKAFIMDSHIVAGVGNIYATEALYQAKIHPLKSAGTISLEQYQVLAKAIKIILKNAIKKGGTTLKDFMKSDGSPGYFSIELQAYGRSGLPCKCCKTILKSLRIAQRSTVYCPICQSK